MALLRARARLLWHLDCVIWGWRGVLVRGLSVRYGLFGLRMALLWLYSGILARLRGIRGQRRRCLGCEHRC